MKKLLFLLMALPALQFAQVGYNITSWYYNSTGLKGQYYSSNGTTVNTLTDSAEVQQVCYNTDTIYVRTDIIPDYIMGPWPGDPFIAGGQNNSYLFPRNPSYPSSTHQTKPTGSQGLLINGVVIFDDGDGKSYNTSTGTNNNAGAGVWNQIAWVAHASEMDAGMGHPDPSKIYHNHSNPVKLCSVTSSTTHSPLIGWSFDGWPIYGPFGYSVATNANSAVTRMTSSWALRNITTRTTLYTGATTSQTGPPVSTSFPLGTYIEDYGYTAGSGDLDYYNGRYCVTPEFPSGTYAYFLNTDASGNPSYPNMIGPKYYGSVFLTNFGTNGGNASAPKVGVSCYTGSSTLYISSVSSSSVTCNGLSTGSATVTPAGGSGSYTYTWSPSGGNAAIASSLAAGTYSCLVSDGSTSTTQTVTIAQATAITPTISAQTNVKCNGNSTGSVTLSVSGGAGSYTYSWSPSGGTSSTATSLAAGTYTCTIKDANLCSKTQTVTITQPTVISPSVTATSSVACNGNSTGSVTLSVSGGTGSYTYSWSPSGGNAATATSLAAGTYTCTIKDANLCSKTQTVTISQATAIVPSVSSQSVLCNGNSTGSATVSATGGTGSYTYTWSPSGGNAATASSLAAGTYTCTIKDGNLCSKTQTVTISQPTAISCSVSSQSVACNGNSTGSATVSVSGGTSGYTYTWSPSGGSAATASSLAAGTYTCTITDGNSCTKTQTVTIAQATAISSSISSQSVSCNGNSTGSATVSASGGTGSFTYSWSPSGGSAATASSLAAGTYTCTIKDGNLCSQTQTVTINQPTAITSSATSQSTTCSGSTGSATVTASGGTGSYTYSWSPSGGTAATASSLAAGTYTCTIKDGNLCSHTQTVTISQPVAISSNASSQNVTCNGGNDGAATVSASGGTGSYTYTWAPSGGSAATASSLTAGTYTCTILDGNLCSQTQTVSITEPAAIAGSQTVTLCSGGSITVGANTYTASGTYNDLFTASNGCDSTFTTYLTVNSAIDVSTSQNGNVLSSNASSATYQWIDCNNNNAALSGETAQSYTAASSGSYAVIVTVGSCSDTSNCVTVSTTGIVNSSAQRPGIFPNPNKGQFSVVLYAGGEHTLTVTDLLGQSLLEQKIGLGKTDIDMQNLKEGVYVVTIRGASENTTQRMVITR